MTAFSRIRSSRAWYILMIAFLGLAIAYLGFSLGNTRATTNPSGSDFGEVVAGMATPVDGHATISIDQKRNIVCVKTRDGKGSGIACNSADQAKPLILENGGSPTDPVHVVVVDLQHRLGSVEAVVSGQRITEGSQDGGLSIEMHLPRAADELQVLDLQGNALSVTHPGATQSNAIQLAQELSQPGR